MNFIRLPGSHYHLSAARRWPRGAVGPAGCGGCGHPSSTRGPPQPQPPLGLLPCSPGTRRRSCLPWVVVGGKYFPQPRLCVAVSLCPGVCLSLCMVTPTVGAIPCSSGSPGLTHRWHQGQGAIERSPAHTWARDAQPTSLPVSSQPPAPDKQPQAGGSHPKTPAEGALPQAPIPSPMWPGPEWHKGLPWREQTCLPTGRATGPGAGDGAAETFMMGSVSESIWPSRAKARAGGAGVPNMLTCWVCGRPDGRPDLLLAWLLA